MCSLHFLNIFIYFITNMWVYVYVYVSLQYLFICIVVCVWVCAFYIKTETQEFWTSDIFCSQRQPFAPPICHHPLRCVLSWRIVFFFFLPFHTIPLDSIQYQASAALTNNFMSISIQYFSYSFTAKIMKNGFSFYFTCFFLLFPFVFLLLPLLMIGMQ